MKMNEILAMGLVKNLENNGMAYYMQLAKEKKKLIAEAVIFLHLSDESKATISRAMIELGEEFMRVFCCACGMKDPIEIEVKNDIERLFPTLSDDLKEKILTQCGATNLDEAIERIMAKAGLNKYAAYIDSISKCLPDEIKYFFSKMISQEGENATLAFLSDVCNQNSIGSNNPFYGGTGSKGKDTFER